MKRTKINYVPVKRNYNAVKYFPFKNEPGDSYVLTSDPWNYLKAFIKNAHDKIKKKTSKTAPQKMRLNKALYFVSLAESFQKSADSVDLPTKGTLTYYSILNITKAFLLVRGHDLETSTEYHGLSLSSNDKDELTISKFANSGGINIFHEFAKEIGYTVDPSRKISLQEMVSNLPEVHELAYNLQLLKPGKRKFLPVTIEFISNENKWTQLSYRILFEKKHKNNYPVEKFEKGELRMKLNKCEDIDGCEVFSSKTNKHLTSKSDTSWRTGYDALCNEINGIKVRLMLTRVGYKYYLDLQPDSYHPLLYCFSLMFYIGSVARYRPTLNEEILEGRYKALISEAMKSSPKQFLFVMTGMITKKICAIPMANLD